MYIVGETNKCIRTGFDILTRVIKRGQNKCISNITWLTLDWNMCRDVVFGDDSNIYGFVLICFIKKTNLYDHVLSYFYILKVCIF